MTFKEKITIARAEHYSVHKVKVSNAGVADVIWPDSPYGSKRTMMSNAIKYEIDLKASQIISLMDLFKETNAQFWVQ